MCPPNKKAAKPLAAAIRRAYLYKRPYGRLVPVKPGSFAITTNVAQYYYLVKYHFRSELDGDLDGWKLLHTFLFVAQVVAHLAANTAQIRPNRGREG